MNMLSKESYKNITQQALAFYSIKMSVYVSCKVIMDRCDPFVFWSVGRISTGEKKLLAISHIVSLVVSWYKCLIKVTGLTDSLSCKES